MGRKLRTSLPRDKLDAAHLIGWLATQLAALANFEALRGSSVREACVARKVLLKKLSRRLVSEATQCLTMNLSVGHPEIHDLVIAAASLDLNQRRGRRGFAPVTEQVPALLDLASRLAEALFGIVPDDCHESLDVTPTRSAQLEAIVTEAAYVSSTLRGRSQPQRRWHLREVADEGHRAARLRELLREPSGAQKTPQPPQLYKLQWATEYLDLSTVESTQSLTFNSLALSYFDAAVNELAQYVRRINIVPESPSLCIDVANGAIVLHGRPYTGLDKLAVKLFFRICERRGEWVKGRVIKDRKQDRPDVILRNELPDPVYALIESKRGVGYRLIPRAVRWLRSD